MVIISVSWRLLRVCSVFGEKWARMWMCVFLPRQWMRARAVIVLVMRWTDLLGLVVSLVALAANWKFWSIYGLWYAMMSLMAGSHGCRGQRVNVEVLVEVAVCSEYLSTHIPQGRCEGVISLGDDVQDEAVQGSGYAVSGGDRRGAPRRIGAEVTRPIALSRNVLEAYPVDGAGGYLGRHVTAYVAAAVPLGGPPWAVGELD